MAQEKTKDGLPADKSPANFGQSDDDANAPLREELLRLAEEQEVTFENADDPDAPSKVIVGHGTEVNPSSTYPGRDKELAENDMRIPTALDAAKRAAFAGSQWPARSADAGLSRDDFSFSEGADTETDGAADEAANKNA